MNRIVTVLVVLGIASFGCSRKKAEDYVQKPQIIVEENKKALSAAEQKEAYEKSKNAEENSTEPWGTQVASLAKDVGDTAFACQAKYLSKLKPDELLVGAPALQTPDGVVTVMDDTCMSLVDSLKYGLRLMEGKHPDCDQMLRHWTLFADLYNRASRVAVNIGASAKRRKQNHVALVHIKEQLVKHVGPKLIEATKTLRDWNEKNEPAPDPGKMQITARESLKIVKQQLKKTTSEANELQKEWLARAHKQLKKELYARTRFLQWLGRHWKRRIEQERRILEGIRSGKPEFDRQLVAMGARYYDTLQDVHKDGYEVAMLALQDKGTIDEPKLKEGKKALEKTLKKLRSVHRGLKYPAP